MATLVREPVARKTYKCDRCGKRIEPGQRYAYFAMTPHDIEFGNHNWWHGREHLSLGQCYTETAG